MDPAGRVVGALRARGICVGMLAAGWPLALLLALVLAAGCSRVGGGATVDDAAVPDRDAVLGAAEPNAARLPPPLVLISIDGFRADYLERHPSPTLRRLAAEGVRARALLPVFPTKTFPNHYTIVTGLYPEHHGIVGNTMLDPADGAWFRLSDRDAVQDGRWWGGEPIWVTAQRHGLRSATLFWPGSEAPVAGIRPTEWLPYDESMPPAARIDRALAWLARSPRDRPSLITLYFEQVDDAGHRHGPLAAETAQAVAEVDAVLGRLVDGLESLDLLDRVNLVVVSDHGMTEIAAERVIVLEDLIDLAGVEVVAASTFAMLRPPEGGSEALLERLRGAHPHLRVYSRSEVPVHLDYREHPRITPIVAIADEGWYVYPTHERARRSTPLPAGMHGYDPAVSSMHGLFVARGPAFRSGVTLDLVRSVDLYELMAAALGLPPAANDGDFRRIRELLSPAPEPSS